MLVSGMMRDKETDKMCQRLAGRVRCAVLTKPDHPRAMDAGELAASFAAQGLKTYVEEKPARALERARSLAGPEGIVLVAGSLYLIGEMRTILRAEKEFSHVI